MILADKISGLRREFNWSQEDLAEKMDVSRQSISKWESGNSIPDMNKIIRLSEIFGVSTDYLIKDDVERESAILVDKENKNDKRNISLDEATEYMDTVREFASKISLGVSFCVIAAMPLLGLHGLHELGRMNEGIASGIGLVVLLISVAIGVFLLINANMRLSKFEYIEKTELSLDYGVKGIIEKRMQDFSDIHNKYIAIGVVLCIISVIPIVFLGSINASDGMVTVGVSAALVIISFAVYLLVWASLINGSFKKLLQIDDYTVAKKTFREKFKWFSGAYWLCCTAIFLLISLSTERFDLTWIMWPVAAVAYGAVAAVIRYKNHS